MKKQKDPRPLLLFWLRFSIICLVLIPFIYFNFKKGDINKVILFIVIWIIISLVIKFFYKTTEEYKLHNSVTGGYMFSGGWFFFALICIYVLTKGVEASVFNWILALLLFLFFSFTLFYLAHKSLEYEKKVLRYPHKLQLSDILLTGLLTGILLMIMAFLIFTFLPLFFSKPISTNLIITDVISIAIFVVLLLYAKHRKLFDKL